MTRHAQRLTRDTRSETPRSSADRGVSALVEVHTDGPAMVLPLGEWEALRAEISEGLRRRRFAPEVEAALRRTQVKEVA